MQLSSNNPIIIKPDPSLSKAAARFVPTSKYWPVALLILFSGLILVDRVLMPQVPINVDPASYAVVSHELLEGRSLYVDIWDHKPPGPFIVFAAAELLFGYSPQTLFILNYLVVLIIMLGVYLAAREGPGGSMTGVFAAGLWALVSGTYGLEARDPNTEVFINACTIFAFYLIVLYRKERLPFGAVLSIGLLFLAASLLKPVIVAFAIFIGAAHICFSPKTKAAITDIAMIGAIGVLGWLATFGYFLVTGRGAIFYETVITYNRHYAGNIWSSLVAPLQGNAELLIDIIGPLAIFGLVGSIFVLRFERHLGALITAFVVSGWIAVAAPGRFSVHYFQLWLPPLIVGAAWGISLLASSSRRNLRIASFAAGIVLVVSLIGGQISSYRAVIAHEFVPVQTVLSKAEQTAAFIDNTLADDETFYLWGNSPSLYFLTGRRPPAAIIFDSHLAENPLYSTLAERVKADLALTRPELLVTEFGRPPVHDWIAKDYIMEPIYSADQGFSVFVRRGGRLAGELHLK